MDARRTPPPLAGRRHERERLDRALADAAELRPCLVLVHGEPGVGKTRLVAEACARARAEGHGVLWGRCLRFGATSSPYLPLVTALESWLADQTGEVAAEVAARVPALEPLVPALATTASRPERDRDGGGRPVPGFGAAVFPVTGPPGGGRVLTAWEKALDAVTAQVPAVLVIDDLQWADQSSLDVLAYLATGLRRQRLCLLMTYRDGELPDGHRLHGWLADIGRLLVTEELHLARFTETETREQLRLLFGRDPQPELVAAVWARSRGNPYLSELLVRGLDADASTLPEGLPDALRSALLASWHRLSAPARRLMQVLAVAGRPGPVEHLDDVADGWADDGVDVWSLVREAVGAGVVTLEASGRVWFRHPLLADVLYATLLPGERSALHAAFADATTDSELDTRKLADLAMHCEASGRFDEALDYNLRAAQQAAEVQAIREEAMLRCRAVDLWPQTSESARAVHGTEIDLLAAASYAARWAGDEVTAARLIERARGLVDQAADPLTAARVLTSAGEIAYTSGAVDALPIDEFRSIVDLTSAFPDSVEHARALADLAHSEAWRGEIAPARDHADRAMDAARRAGDKAHLSYAAGARCLAYLGNPVALTAAEDARRFALESGQPEYVALACIATSNALESQGRPGDCATTLMEGYAAARQVGVGGLATYLGVYAAQNRLTVGDTAGAEQMLREVLATRPVGVPGVQAHIWASVAALRHDDVTGATRHLDAAHALAPTFEQQAGLHGPAAVAEYLLAVDQPREALALLQATMETHARAEPKYGDQMLTWGARAAAVWANQSPGDDAPGRHPAVEARQALDLLYAERSKAPVPPFADVDSDPTQRATLALYRAETASLRAAPDAADLWRVAAEEATAAGLHFAALEATLRLADTLVRAGRRHDAAGPLRAACRRARDLAAPAVSREVEALARLARIDLTEPPPLSPPAVALSALAGLTRREQEVLTHLVAGRSYAEIADELVISQKTVGVHVSNLLRKTGTANRVAAAAWARRHGVGTGGAEGI